VLADSIAQSGRLGLPGSPMAQPGTRPHHRTTPPRDDHLFHVWSVLERQPRIVGLFRVRRVRFGEAV
ncbi:hypothetical protein HHI36_015533, partial [Cryptolaemus montrouzieri]